VLDTLRLLQVPEALGPLLFAGLPAAVLLTLVAGGTAASPRRAALLGAVPFGGMLVASAVTRFPHDAPGWLVLAGLGAPLAVLAWINTHPYRRRVAASYALCAVLALCAEGGVRLTALDSSWTRTPGWKRASEEFAELLELRRYRTYPDEGFPVRPPDPDPTHRRIVALGGSSTGGAWQMDDLAQFWPARLGEQLAGTDWEVVNQGVGGWNTLHMRLYVESQVDRLDADILVIYVGHNDILATAPVPYRELYARYQQGASALKGVVDALNGVRLYVGLKHALLAMRDREGAIAVPVADARDNLTAIITAAHAHHARVLLVSEGLNPDPLPMRPYAAMERELAASTDSLFLDGADALWRDGDPDLFLDDCHLSVAGHTKLATWVRDTLTTAGWLGTSGGP
jgi:lysophospholipase L1-like esterase